MEKRGYREWLSAIVAVAMLSVAVALWPVQGSGSSGGATPQAETPAELPDSPDALLRRSWPSPTTWDEAESPNYWRVVGPAVVDLKVPVGEVWYAPLDELGRARRAVGTIDKDTMMAGLERERADMQGIEPSGWGHNAEVSIELPTGAVYQGFFWNRSHLVAKSLGGVEELENLVCGTRMQNVGANDDQGGMAYAEERARWWLMSHPYGTLFYSATPLYVGDELVCRSVLVDMRTSDGELDLELEVYNATKGYAIDYATGRFWALT